MLQVGYPGSQQAEVTTSKIEFDLLVRAGRVVCPATGLDGAGAVAVRGNRIVASGREVEGTSHNILEFPDALLLPGLVDLHAHPAHEGSKYGVDPDVEFLPRGVTTVMSQGDAGASNWERYRESTLLSSRTRVRLAINLSVSGESKPEGCFERLEDVDVGACVAAIEDSASQEAGELIWGIAINVGRICCGRNNPREVMRRALEAAERTGRPLLYGMRTPEDWPFEEQMALLRLGDVVTYTYRPQPVCIIENGRVHPVIREARERGILFDVGHGMASLDFTVLEAAIADGFPPDTISTDSYARHVGSQPPHDLPRTMAKLLAAGMPEADVFAAVTERPARILGLAREVGTLAPGACADLTVLKWRDDAPPLVDVSGAKRPGGCWEAAAVVRAGEVVALEGRRVA